MKISLKSLGRFLGSYFHQDWTCEYSDYISAVNDFLQNTSSETIMGADCDLEILLRTRLSEGELENIILRQLGCNLDPSHLGFSYRQWLIKLKEILDEHIMNT